MAIKYLNNIDLNKNELQKLIGLEIPSYKIVDSKMTHSARFDSEKTTKVTIKFNNKIDAIFWIMKDDTLPPILKINSSTLASTLGATLATKRSSAEHGVNSDELIIEPYANPFRLYPLRNDYNKFKDLFENQNVSCYVINTGYFLKEKVTPEMTLGIIESIVSKTIKFNVFLSLKFL